MIQAPISGLPVVVEYQDKEWVSSPDGRYVTEWLYHSTPPHGDSLFKVRFAGRELPERFWDRGHAWSPDSEYFCLEQYTAKRECFLYVVRACDGCWIKIAENFSATHLAFPVVKLRKYGEGNVLVEYVFKGNENWSHG